MKAITGLGEFLMAVATSSVATGVPPGEFICSTMALIEGFSLAWARKLIIVLAEVAVSPKTVPGVLLSTPSKGIKATLAEASLLKKESSKGRRINNPTKTATIRRRVVLILLLDSTVFFI